MQITLATSPRWTVLAERARPRPHRAPRAQLPGTRATCSRPARTARDVRGGRRDTAPGLGAARRADVPSRPAKRSGRGFGCNMQPYGRPIWFRDRASAWLSVQADGTLLIRSGVTDMGAGQAASLCQIAAEILGVPLDKISIYIGDTALTPPAGGTFATRQLYMSGNAVLQAAQRAARPHGSGRSRAALLPGRRARVRRRARPGRDDAESVTRRSRSAELARRASPAGVEPAHPVHLAGPGKAVRPAYRAGRHLPGLHLRHPCGRGRGRRRDGRGRGAQVRGLPRRRPRHQPDAGRGPDPGRRHAGPRLRAHRGDVHRGRLRRSRRSSPTTSIPNSQTCPM